MNEVFYSLSLAVVSFGSWLALDLPGSYASLIWIAGSWLIFGGISKTIENHKINRRQRELARIQEINGERVKFAPLSNQVTAAIAASISPSMTIAEIENLISRQVPKIQGIHSQTSPISR